MAGWLLPVGMGVGVAGLFGLEWLFIGSLAVVGFQERDRP